VRTKASTGILPKLCLHRTHKEDLLFEDHLYHRLFLKISNQFQVDISSKKYVQLARWPKNTSQGLAETQKMSESGILSKTLPYEEKNQYLTVY